MTNASRRTRSTRARARAAPTPPPPPPPPYVSASDSELTDTEEIDVDEDVAQRAQQAALGNAAVAEPSVEAAAAEEEAPEAVKEDSEEVGIKEVVPQKAEHPCRACHNAGTVCKVFAGARACVACKKTACNVNKRVPSYKSENSQTRSRIYKKLLAAASAGAEYLPPKTSPKNDWTVTYLQAILGDGAMNDPDIRTHLGLGNSRIIPGPPEPAAANVPVAMQPSMASGCGTRTPDYDMNNINNRAAHKRALDNNQAAIEHHEAALKLRLSTE
ncbi:hypothetical protein CF319_g7534 [Tilletia indica]|nr:hypothetical protein CF319_g7534 [Tilletia indica]